MGANLRLPVFLAGLLGLALAQDAPLTRSQLTIDRNDSEIRVIQNGISAQGAEFIPSNSNCEEGNSLGVVYAPPPGFVETLVNDTRIVSTVAFLRRPDDTEDEETLELFDGSLDLDPATLCPTNVQRTEETITVTEGAYHDDGQSVLLQQRNRHRQHGRTHRLGARRRGRVARAYSKLEKLSL